MLCHVKKFEPSASPPSFPSFDVRPVNLVNRLFSNHFPDLKYIGIRKIRDRVRNFDYEVIQSLSPRTTVAGAIYLQCEERGWKMSLRTNASSCAINEKSLYSLLARLQAND